MRLSAGLALAVLVVAGATACGSGGHDSGVASANGTARASSSATGGANGGTADPDAPVKYAKCMRENGVPDFPDPKQNDGGFQMQAPSGADPEAMKAASAKCKQYLPDGGAQPKSDPQAVEKMRQYAKCMRDNGIANFPDPDPASGQLVMDDKSGISPDDPKFKAATQACQNVLPSRGPNNVHTGGPS